MTACGLTSLYTLFCEVFSTDIGLVADLVLALKAQELYIIILILECVGPGLDGTHQFL